MPMSMARAKKAVLAQWILLGGALLAMGAGLTLNLYQDRQRTLDSESERLMAQAAIVEQIVSASLESLNLVLVKLADERVEHLPVAEANTRLKALEEGMTGVRTLTVLNARGAIVASSRPEILGGNYIGREYFQSAKALVGKDVLIIGRPFVTVLGTRTINVCRALRGAGGQFEGVVSATLDPAYFSPLLGAVIYAPDMWAHLVHFDGDVFLDMPKREGVAGMNLAVPGTLFSRHVESGKSFNVFLETVWATGQRRMLAVRTVKPAGLEVNRPLVVGLARDPEAILVRWRSDALMQGALYLALAALVVPGLALYQRRQRQFDIRAAQAALALRESERFMRTVTDNIPGMVGYWDKGLRCRFANVAYQEWFGRSLEQLLGVSIHELLGPALYAKNEQYITAALEGQPQHFERTIRRPDGTVRHTQAHYIPDVEDGGVRGFFVLINDISDLKQAQTLLEDRVAERTEELRRVVTELSASKVQAESASRAKSAFLANLSHELRTPLNPILALTELVLTGDLTPEQRDYLEEVNGAARRLLSMFERLFDLVALEDYSPESSAVRLEGLRAMLLEEIRPLAEQKGLALDGGVDPALPPYVWLDLNLMRMAAQEACRNALRFTAQGGLRVSFRAEESPAGTGPRICLEIADTGQGIDPERLPSVRSGFTQGEAPLTKRFCGLGVGMAMIGRAVELMAGELQIDSSPGKGTTVRIYVPLCPAPQDLASQADFTCTGQA